MIHKKGAGVFNTTYDVYGLDRYVCVCVCACKLLPAGYFIII